MSPILAAAVGHFRGNERFNGYALEISHHVIGEVLGITLEEPENIVLVLPRRAAERLIAVTELDDQQAAISRGLVLVNAQPIDLYLGRAAVALRLSRKRLLHSQSLIHAARTAQIIRGGEAT